MVLPNSSETEASRNGGSFICGVVEGFYGRPWTSHQRKKLFKRMGKMCMNTYLYAPKDDSKHRMYWRDLYTVEEADHLTKLINAAEEQNVTFVYALSPGLDMTYSNSKEVTCLKRKLEQVSSFGCKAFALLFDDIEVEMCEADKQIFQSFAQAQVSVTNEVYQYLNQPERFLFCPTEYCATRAVPAVGVSEYLTTIGSKLLPAIDVMWTGPKVVSKKITINSIEEIAKVLQRAPVIWDNIHANDYDQRRLFLGPYEGRSPELIPYLKGVLTNPNCEFEANFVAFHTLSQWSKSNVDGIKRDFLPRDSPVSADIKLETDGEYSSDEDSPVNMTSAYVPKVALSFAIKDWLEEFYRESRAVKKITQPVVASVVGLTTVPATVTAAPTTVSPTLMSVVPALGTSIGVQNLNQLAAVDVADSFMQPSTVVPMNSLLDSLSSSSESDTESPPEPMDGISLSCSSNPGGIASVSSAAGGTSSESSSLNEGFMPMDLDSTCSEASVPANTPAEISPADSKPVPQPDCSYPQEDLSGPSTSGCLNVDDVRTLVDLFYMPFEYGSSSITVLNELVWLKFNAVCLTEGQKKESKLCGGSEDAAAPPDDWHTRACDFQTSVRNLATVIDRFCAIPNKALVDDLYPYFWDMKSVLYQLDTFVSWLALGHVPCYSAANLPGSPYTWANVNYRELFSRGDQEPWVFRGGLQAEIQRLLPLEGAPDLLCLPYPKVPDISMHRIRPFTHSDQQHVYAVCRQTCDDGMDGTEIFPDQPNLIGDKLVGAFVSLSPEFCFVVDDGEGVCGHVLAAPCARELHRRSQVEWLPAMQNKYPRPVKEEGLSPAEELISNFYTTSAALPESFYARFPAVVRVDLLQERCDRDVAVAKRALSSVVAVLKLHGVHGIHVAVHVGDHNTVELYNKLGLSEVPTPDAPEDMLLLARTI